MSKAKTLLINVPLKAAAQWWNDDAMTLAAALAFYTMFSLAPLVVIALAVAGWVVGDEAARNQLMAQAQFLIGREGAQLLSDTIAHASKEQDVGRMAALVGIVTLVLGSTGVFAHLQASLNTVWGVKPKVASAKGTLWQYVRVRLLSFGMVLAVGFLLLVSLVASAVLAAAHDYINVRAPGMAAVWWTLNFILTLALVSLLFALIFKVLPDVKITWSDVWIGAVVTAVLFGLGKFVIGFYLGNSALASTYGAAGSLVVVLVWVYFSGCILYYGAEFTQVYARNFGTQIRPASYAEQVEPERAEADEDIEETPHGKHA